MSSDKGTVHVFAIKDEKLNRRSSYVFKFLLEISRHYTGNSKIFMNCLRLSSLIAIGKYVENLWSYSSFTIPPECACICAFGEKQNSVIGIYLKVIEVFLKIKNLIIIIFSAACVNGTFYRAKFGQNNTLQLSDYDNFLDICGDDKF